MAAYSRGYYASFWPKCAPVRKRRWSLTSEEYTNGIYTAWLFEKFFEKEGNLCFFKRSTSELKRCDGCWKKKSRTFFGSALKKMCTKGGSGNKYFRLRRTTLVGLFILLKDLYLIFCTLNFIRKQFFLLLLVSLRVRSLLF